MHKYWLLAAQIIASICCAIAFANNLIIISILIANALIWIACNQRRWYTYGALSLLIIHSLSLFGLAQGNNSLLLVIGCISALLAWDLERFEQRLHSVEQIHNPQQLSASHLKYALSASCSALALVLLSSQLQISINFWWICGLALVGIVLLSRLLSSLSAAKE